MCHSKQKLTGALCTRRRTSWALWLGLPIFLIALASVFGPSTLGWVNSIVGNWLDPAKSIATVSKAYAWLHPVASMIPTYLFIRCCS